MTTKEVAGICGVTDKTIYNNADKANVILEHGKSHDWTEDEVKRLQLVLMRNATNAGGQQTDKSTIKSTLESTFQSGLTIQELIRSGNVDAMKEFMGIVVEATEQQKILIESQKQNKALIEQNTQLIEQKNAAEAETERIKQYNRNFHNSLYTATEVANMLGVTPNRIGREAKNHNLKIEPLYGMLGKIKLSNGKLVSQFCYNDDAVRILKAIICTD